MWERLRGQSRGYIFHFFAEDIHPYVEVLNSLSREEMIWSKDKEVALRISRYAEKQLSEDLEWLVSHGIVLQLSTEKKIILS